MCNLLIKAPASSKNTCLLPPPLSSRMTSLFNELETRPSWRTSLHIKILLSLTWLSNLAKMESRGRGRRRHLSCGKWSGGGQGREGWIIGSFFGGFCQNLLVFWTQSIAHHYCKPPALHPCIPSIGVCSLFHVCWNAIEKGDQLRKYIWLYNYVMLVFLDEFFVF